MDASYIGFSGERKEGFQLLRGARYFFFLHIRWASRATWKRKRKKPMNPVRRGNSGPPTSLVNNATSQRPEIKTDNYHRTDGCTINTNLMMSKGVTWTSVHSLFIHSWITAKSTRWCEMTHLSGFSPLLSKGLLSDRTCHAGLDKKRSNPLSCKATTREPINLD